MPGTRAVPDPRPGPAEEEKRAGSELARLVTAGGNQDAVLTIDFTYSRARSQH